MSSLCKHFNISLYLCYYLRYFLQTCTSCPLSKGEINPFQNKLGVLHASCKSPLKTLWEKEKLLVQRTFSPFPTVFCITFEIFLPFSSNLELLSGNTFSLEESKICHLEKGYTARAGNL